MLRIPRYLDNRLKDDGKVVSLCTGRAFLPRNIISLLPVLISVRCPIWLEGLGKLKKFIHLIGSRTRDLPDCNRVPQLLLEITRINSSHSIMTRYAIKIVKLSNIIFASSNPSCRCSQQRSVIENQHTLKRAILWFYV
jgi:hypothetical protein